MSAVAGNSSDTSVRTCCPLRQSLHRDETSFFQHINSEHVCRRSFPSVSFQEDHDRRVCSACGFIYARRWRSCRRSLGGGHSRCCGRMDDPGISPWLCDASGNYGRTQPYVPLSRSATGQSLECIGESDFPTSSIIPIAEQLDQTCDDSLFSATETNDIVLTGIKAAALLSSPDGKYLDVFNAVMNEISTLPVYTVSHIPRSVRPLLSEVLSVALRHAYADGLWGFVRLIVFAKSVLRAPSRRGRKKRHVVKSLLFSRLHQWREEHLVELWEEARNDAMPRETTCDGDSIRRNNMRRAIKLAEEGRYRDGMRCLVSQGCAPHSDPDALQDLLQRHPQHDLPAFSEDLPAPLAIDFIAVLTTLRAFPRGTSTGRSQLRAQHLLEAVAGSVVPVTQTCLDQLTRLMSFIVSEKLNASISPLLVGAPLTALRQKTGGYRPIAVGEVIRRLASRLCCAAAKSRLPDLLLPYGQVGVGTKGGLEAAIHTLRTVFKKEGHKDDLCCFKVDMQNAFNECDRSSFLERVKEDLPDLFPYVQWCYTTTKELRFGQHRIMSTTGVQQGDLLGPLLFSLVVLQLLDTIGPIDGLFLHVWYLDDVPLLGPETLSLRS